MQVRCGTGDSFVMAPDPWFVTADIDCVDMEGWALAYVAQQFDIPFRSFKYISDMADENAAEEWANNVADGAGKFLDIYDKL
jgi:adenosylhomocysteine nucleosidase